MSGYDAQNIAKEIRQTLFEKEKRKKKKQPLGPLSAWSWRNIQLDLLHYNFKSFKAIYFFFFFLAWSKQGNFIRIII